MKGEILEIMISKNEEKFICRGKNIKDKRVEIYVYTLIYIYKHTSETNTIL